MKKQIRKGFRKGDIVQLIKNPSMVAKIGAIGKVIAGKRGRSPYFEIEWIDKNARGQMNGFGYYQKYFRKLTVD